MSLHPMARKRSKAILEAGDSAVALRRPSLQTLMHLTSLQMVEEKVKSLDVVHHAVSDAMGDRGGDEKAMDEMAAAVDAAMQCDGLTMSSLLNGDHGRAVPVKMNSPSGSWPTRRCRPCLEDIYEDKELFDCLLTFMQRIYCSESILFLFAIRQYKKEVLSILEQMEQGQDDDLKTTLLRHEKWQQIIDFRAGGILNCYIVPDAPHQGRST